MLKLTRSWRTVSVCPGCQQGFRNPLFKDSHHRDQHQHCPQHQLHRCLRLLRPQRGGRADCLWDPHEAFGAVQSQEPQRTMGGLGEQSTLNVLYAVVEVIQSISISPGNDLIYFSNLNGCTKAVWSVFQVKSAYFDRVNLSANGFYKWAL